jgi:hypothetical protein
MTLILFLLMKMVGDTKLLALLRKSIAIGSLLNLNPLKPIEL